MSSTRGALIVVAFALSACPLPTDLVTAHCEARAAANCEWLQRCGVFSQFVCPRAPEDCAILERPLLAAQKLSFDSDAGAACVDAWANRACDPLSRVPEDCADVFVGTGTEGGDCGTCGAGLECVFFSVNCGRCRPRDPPSARHQVGESCPDFAGPGCAEGLACLGTCEPYVGLGEECTMHACAMGLHCEPSDGGASCRPYPERNEACSAQLPCKSGLRCAAGFCAHLLERGASCTNGFDCMEGRCDQGTCVALFVGLGADCTSARCDPALRCSGDHVCVRPLPEGAACEGDLCEAGAECRQGACFTPALASCR